MLSVQTESSPIITHPQAACAVSMLIFKNMMLININSIIPAASFRFFDCLKILFMNLFIFYMFRVPVSKHIGYWFSYILFARPQMKLSANWPSARL